jgi:hypothetical protein
MATEEERCDDFRKFKRIDDAFRAGDLAALRNAVDDPGIGPNGRMPDTVGPCLIYAIYHSPFTFIRTLLEIGADPNAAVDDGFPSLIAALCCTRDTPGATTRTDVDDILRLLLAFGADPDQRGINDYTPLHMAVAERNPNAVQILLDGGANPELRTRIDECETPLDMAKAAGLTTIVTLFEQGRQPVRRRLRSGVALLWEIPGHGEVIRRHRNYRIRLRLWLSRIEPVRWSAAWGPAGVARLADNGETLMTEVRIDRKSLIAGLFYGVEGMRVGGTRRLEIAPHLAYGARGVPGLVPANAMLTAEIGILDAVPPRASG